MPKVRENWTCRYCGKAQVISQERFKQAWYALWLEECETGDLAYWLSATVCANQECRRLSLEVALGHRIEQDGADFKVDKVMEHWSLLPASSAKPQPDYIPWPLRVDYSEACAIRDLSPKASATLSRRCLQGMIRDFCGIPKKRTLFDEIKELRSLVDNGKAPAGVQADTMDAIDHVRQIGNIGAHMEADIDVIIDVDEGEAQALIDLIELLFDDWYVARYERTEKIKKVGVIAAAKAQAKQQGAQASAAATPAISSQQALSTGGVPKTSS